MATPGRKPLTGGRVSTLGGPWGLLLGILVFSLFYALHLRGQHLPHYLSEMFVVVVAVGVFMLTWNGRRFLDNHFFLFLGISYLFVGVIDGLHALAFDGWIGGKENIDIQFWYAARYFQAASFVTALLFVVRKFRPGVALAVLSAVAASLVGAISGGMFHGWFDHAAHPWFMGMNDLALFGLGAAAYAMLRRKREHFDRELLDCLSLSILIAVLSGVAEGLGMRGYAKLFLLGDLFLALSFYLVYKAVIQTGLIRPYDMLFRNLKRSEEEARAARSGLEARVFERTAELRGVNERLARELAERKAMEREREMTIDLLRLINNAKTIKELVSDLTSFLRERSGCESVAIRYRVGSEFPYMENNGFVEDDGFPDGFAYSAACVCAAGKEGDPVDAGPRIPTRRCTCGAIVPGGADPSDPLFGGEKAFWTNSVTALLAAGGTSLRPVVRDRCRKEEFESFALIPLRSGEGTFGFLQFGDRREDLFTPDLIAEIERAAGHVAAAVARHLAKEALRESEDRFRSLVENVPVGILIVRDGRIAFGNPGVRRLFGDLVESARFRDIGRVLPEDSAKFDGLCDTVERADEGRQETDLRFLLPEGDDGRTVLRWVYCQSVRIEYQGRTASLLVLNDVTRMKDLEQIVSTREKLSIIGQMAAGIAHEIRNPLSGININVSTLDHVVRNLEGISLEDRDKVREIVLQSKAASDKIATVIRRVMDFTKQAPPKLGRVDVNQVVREALAFSSVTLRKSGIAVEERPFPGLPVCNADPRLLEQVLLNLITNAVQAMEDAEGEKRLGVAAVLQGDTAIIRVFDNGPGVPAHIRERIFDPFFTTRKTGHGIGLSFSRRVIENHGGTLVAGESEWGGAEFRIALPVAAEGSPA